MHVCGYDTNKGTYQKEAQETKRFMSTTCCPDYRLRLLRIERRKQGVISCRLLQIAGWLFLLATTAYRSPAQVIPAFRTPLNISIFGTFTDVKPNKEYFTDLAVYGFSAGGYLQTRHVLGVEIRGSITRWGGGQHEESALGGPRAALHVGNFSPYVGVLGGGGNAWSWNYRRTTELPPPRKLEDTGLQWTALGGLDVHIRHRISLRIGEVSYSRLYVKGKTITPVGASAGIVYRIN
jgi:hypothetical protein